jgi:hypothetical protein
MPDFNEGSIKAVYVLQPDVLPSVDDYLRVNYVERSMHNFSGSVSDGVSARIGNLKGPIR